MHVRNILASGGLAAKLFVLFLCVFQVAAEADHGAPRHPREFVARGRPGGQPQRPASGGSASAARPAGAAGPYNGPWHQRTWYSTLRKRFDEVPVDGDNGIHTEEFLDASQSLPSFFDLLGQVAFRPARIDNEQNIKKIRDYFNGHRDQAGTLQKLVQNEKNSGVSYTGSASEALSWLARTLDFTVKSLRKDLDDNKNSPPDDANPKKPLSEAFKKSYPDTLKMYHNDYQKALFAASWDLVPARRTFYQRLAADDSAQAASEDTEKWVSALEKINDILSFVNQPQNRWWY
ncbi:Pleckstrin homology domain-containing family A member 8 [Cyphellophora attinorum]|uniref:Pleckstrin homology domain-containing family A member 8 n=1 Tax=Cyphellophora attinorum TaxID=1664694 RepID=A0A0N1H609_9EURO|nr:Pleckstrin homology domain-containing family A member 8 [Phialophora attinorum]KPI38010.1 Pleckstrin homology domain-containing family A member 8 [Phialophora attinorum]